MTVTGIATARAQDAIRIRGAIEGVDGSTYLVKARDGAELKVVLADNPQIASIVKASLSDIKQGTFVGVTAMPKADGSQSALEVHIFPKRCAEQAKVTTPGSPAESTMTNANVEQVVTAVDGPTLTLKYKDGEKKIFVPADTPIVVYAPGTRAISSRVRKCSSSRSSSRTERCKPAHGGSAGMGHATDITLLGGAAWRGRSRRARSSGCGELAC